MRYRTGAEKLMDISDVAYSTWFKSLRLDRMEDEEIEALFEWFKANLQ